MVSQAEFSIFIQISPILSLARNKSTEKEVSSGEEERHSERLGHLQPSLGVKKRGQTVGCFAGFPLASKVWVLAPSLSEFPRFQVVPGKGIQCGPSDPPIAADQIHAAEDSKELCLLW